MSLLEDIEDRFGETESRINAVVQHLERLGSLEQSLDGAGRGLGEASKNIGNLAVSTRTAVESLNGTLDALRQAVEVLQRSDPARTSEVIAKIGTEIEGIGDRTARFESDSTVFRDRLLSEISGVTSQISDESQETRTTIAAAAESSSSETGKVIENAAVRLAGQQQESTNGVKLPVYVILVLVLLLASLQFYSFISVGHG